MTDFQQDGTDGLPKGSLFEGLDAEPKPSASPSQGANSPPPLSEAPQAKSYDENDFSPPKGSLFEGLDQEKLDREEPGFWATLASHGAANAVPFAGAIAGAETGGIGGLAVGGPIGGFVGAIGGGLAGAYGASKVQAATLGQLPAETQKSISDYLEKGENAHWWAATIGENVPLLLTFKPSLGAGMAKAGEGASRLQQIAASGFGHAAANGVVVGGIPVVQSYITGDPLDWQKWAVNTTLGTIFSSPYSYMQRFGIGVSGYRSLQEAAEKNHAPPPELQADIERGKNPANVTVNRILEEGVWDHEGVYAGTEKPIEEIQSDRAEQRRKELTPFQRNVYGAAHDENKDLFDRWHAVQREIDEYLPHVAATEEAGITGIAPSLANHLRDAMQERDELAPHVRAALRDADTKAQGRFSPDLFLRAEERGGEQPAVPGDEAAGEPPVSGAAEPPPLAPDTQAAYDRIAADFSKRLVEGGRLEESARMGGHLVAHQVINRAAWMGEDPWAFYEREGYQVRARGGEAPPPKPAPEPVPHAATVDDVRSRLEEMRGEPSEATPAPQPTAAAAEQAPAEEPKNPAPLTPQSAWEALAASSPDRDEFLERVNKSYVKGKYNRTGTPQRARAFQEWEPGNLVDVGFTKGLLAVEKIVSGPDKGGWRMLGKPDADGKSQEYIKPPHGGMQKGEKVDFLETTKALRETAQEPASIPEAKPEVKELEPAPEPTPEPPAQPAAAEEPINEINVKPKRVITRKFPSLFEMLASEGGLAPTNELKAVLDGNPFIPGFGRLIREGGRTLEDGLRSAKDLGYMHDEGEFGEGELKVAVNDLLDKIREESHGSKIYSAHDHAEMQAEQARKDAKQYDKDHKAAVKALKKAPALKADAEWSPEPEIMDRAAHLMAQDEWLTPYEAYQDALFERTRDQIEGFDQDEGIHNAVVAETGEIPGWDHAVAEPWVSEPWLNARAGDPHGEAGGLREGVPGEGGREAGGAGGEHAPATEAVLAQRGEPAFEPGAEGKPQQLIPGVKPVTDRERAELAVGKPLTGGNAPPPEGGLFDENARNQQELFQRQTPPFDWTPGGGSKTVKIGDTTLDYGIARDGKTGEVIRVTTDPSARGQGSARAAMEALINKADSEGTTLFLNSEPMGKGGLSKAKLDAFYKSLGFVKNMGRNKDFTSTAEFVRQSQEPQELFQKGKSTLGGIDVSQVPYRIFFDPKANETTIVHELWHGFFQDMRRDLDHPNAPQQLKDDYKALIDWLKPKEEGKISRQEHEKVARAGEIYAMTGAAPTRALARIFDKFREWMSSIYRAVRPGKELSPTEGLMASTRKGERPPELTDAARKVFDRWFTGYGDRPIISETEAFGRTIHDEHELDLERAKQAPHEAVAIAQHAEGELDRHVQETPESIRLEAGTAGARPPEPVSEGGVERPGSAEIGANRPEPVKASGGVGAGSGPVPSRLGEHEDDTGGTRGKPTTALDIATRPSSEGFREPAEPDFTDKAGNLKKDWTTRDDDIWDTIAENHKNDPGIATPGRRTDKEVDDIVHSFGIPSHELADGILDKINNRLKEEDIQLLKTYFTNVASEVKRLSDVYEKDPTNENLRDHLIAKARMTEIQNAMMSATAQSGRNLRTFSRMKDILSKITNDMTPELFQQQLMEATGKTARQLKSEVAQLHATKTPEEVARITARLPTLGGALEDFWKGNILSGLTTVSRIFCGQGTGLINQLVERQLAGLISEARQAIPGLARPEGVERVRLGEAAAAAKGVGSNVGTAYKAALHGLMGEGVSLPGEEPGETPFAHGRVTPMADVGNTTTKAAIYASYQGIRDAFKTYDHLSAGEKGAILDLAFNTPGSRVPDVQIGPVNIPIGQANMLMSKTHAAMHAAWRVGGFAMEIHGQAYRQAAMELDAGKIQPGDFDGRVDYWTRNPTEQMVANARDTANIAGGVGIKEEVTGGPLIGMAREADKWVIGGNNWYGGFRPAGFIMPFRRIMTALMVEGLQKRTPLGLFSGGVRNDIMGKNGAVRQDLALSRMAMGTAITMLAGYEALNGNITGAEPADPKLREAFYRMGYQPYSFRMPGGHNWISYKGILGPASLYMGLAADTARAAHALNHGETAEAFNYALEGFFHNILDESMMRGVSDFAKVFDPRTWTEHGATTRYVESVTSGFIPFSSLANNIRQYQDPYRRHVQTFADYMANRVPYSSQTLAPEIDVWGRPTQNAQSLIPMTAIRMSTETRDPVDAKLAKIGYFPARAKDTHQGEKLSPEQYVFFATLRGQTARGMVEKLVNSPQFDRMSTDEQHQELKKRFGSATTMAWAATSQKWPALSQQATIKKHQDRERKTENFNLIAPSGEND